MKEQRAGKRLFSIEESAVRLGRTPGAVRELVYKGIIPFVQFDRRIFIDVQDLDALIEQSKKINTN